RYNTSDVLIYSFSGLNSLKRIYLDIFNMWFSRYMQTEVYQSLADSINSNPLITGKNQLYGTALPC
ncbi:MAG: hypothetical protein ACLTZG_26165, partial [Hungatella hathewayi]|uniref:hypothetical protein n=1 Tax=Hungatella hathewayi TaxID=154046 RepID=UPI00399236CB